MDSNSVRHQVLVLMPALNEAGRIGAVIRGIDAALPGAKVVVVNDGSSDQTAEEAAAAGATVLPHAFSMGYGASLETGYLYAERMAADFVLQMDGDGQHLPSELPLLLGSLTDGTADIVIGSRYAGRGCYCSPWVRRVGQRFFGAVLRVVTGRRFTDPTSGFQGLSRRAVRLFAAGVFPCDYPDADVLLMAHLAGLRIVEVPVEMKTREGGVSMHAGWKPFYYALKMSFSVFIVLLNRARWKRWGANPERA